MAIIRWEPFRMEDFPELRLPKFGSDLAVDVYEDNKNVYAEMQLPGVDPDNIEIDVEEDMVRVSGVREEEVEKKDKNYYYQEISRGSFERAFRLPNRVKTEEVTADFEEGILQITMPKSQERRRQMIKPIRKAKRIESKDKTNVKESKNAETKEVNQDKKAKK